MSHGEWPLVAPEVFLSLEYAVRRDQSLREVSGRPVLLDPRRRQVVSHAARLAGLGRGVSTGFGGLFGALRSHPPH